MTTATLTRPPQTGLAIWWSIPLTVRRLLRARVPLHCEEHSSGAECLIVAVGSGVPLRWLYVAADAEGALSVRLWEVRQRNKQIAAADATADTLPALLQKWARDFGLS